MLNNIHTSFSKNAKSLKSSSIEAKAMAQQKDIYLHTADP